MEYQAIMNNKVIVIVILACALFLRLNSIYKYDLWFDELGTNDFTYSQIKNIAGEEHISNISGVLNKIKNDPHSPLYYVTVYYCSYLLGEGKVIRLVSVLFSILSLIIFYFICQHYFNKTVGILALLLMSLNPFHIWYAQEMRGYSMAVFLSLLTLFMCIKAVKVNALRFWIFFIIAGILTVFTSYFSSLLIIGSGCILFDSKTKHIFRKWLASVAIIFSALYVLSSLLIFQLAFVKNNFWLTAPNINQIFFSWNVFNLGYTASFNNYALGGCVFTILCLIGLFANSNNRKAIILAVIFFFVFPLLSILTMSYVIMPIYINRQLIIFTPIIYILIANGLESIPIKRIKLTIFSIVVLLLNLSLLNYYNGKIYSDGKSTYLLGGVTPKTNYNDALKFLAGHYRNGDLIATTDLQSYEYFRSIQFNEINKTSKIPESALVFLFNPSALTSFQSAYLKLNNKIELLPENKKNQMHYFPLKHISNEDLKLFETSINEYNRIWVVITPWVSNGSMSFNSQIVLRLISDQFQSKSYTIKDGIMFYLFE